MEKAIVIGGGIAGCSTAYALAKRGTAVTLLERHPLLAQEASGNPLAMLYPKLETSSSIASHGFAYTNTLLKALPNNHLFYAQCGQIQLAFNAREQKRQNTLLDQQTHTVKIQQLTANEASEIAHIHLNMGGLYLPEAGWVKPQALCKALVASNQISCLTTTDAVTLKATDNGWTIWLNQGETIAAEHVIICNANDIKQFDHCKQIPITPVRGQINFFNENNLSQTMRSIICTDHYLSPSVNGVHAIGTSYAPNDPNPHLSEEDTSANLQALAHISPELFSQIALERITGRVAWRSATKDYLPLAGQLIDEARLRNAIPRYNDAPSVLPWLHGLYINAGHGSKGMITAPLCGELIASLIHQTSLPLDASIAASINPNRFTLKALGLKRLAQNIYY